MSQSIRVGHDIIKTGDKETRNYPSICDSNGEVVLSLCRKCNRGEVQLEEPCVTLVSATPDGDKLIAYMARVSNPKATTDMDSSKLIGFLLRNHHWSPFEMAHMVIEVNTTRDITAQIIRHRSMSFQEFSTRYADVEELENYKECRFQDEANRQNSFTADQVDGTSRNRSISEDVRWWNTVVKDMAMIAEFKYGEARKRGIAKEVARSILPMGLVPSKIYISASVRSWLHYVAERTKPGVQKEHREIALLAEKMLKRSFPAVYQAYKENGLQ